MTDETASEIEYDPADFSAVARVRDGVRWLTLQGAGTTPSTGWRLWVEPGNEGIYNDPTDRHFDIHSQAPDFPVFTPTKTELTGELEFTIAPEVTNVRVGPISLVVVDDLGPDTD
jgi:hypothetical protein